ncbi:MAG TPA: hypothetical protein VMF51_13715 [Nocardioides sp.]|jgi:hypothetical protein|uniref:hypothetical protein n=1 Tax=Nocardioides sp. TaxID=35761 RepID=UPI002B5E3B95|nr:hypothetical protein [Nocardioides sp.]HTW16187.1 hypothetical protein [Nocardioides sp.]
MSIATKQLISHHVLEDPASGQAVDARVGDCVQLVFRRRLGASRWRVAQRPSYLVPIEDDGHVFSFLVFGSAELASSGDTVRMERQRSGRPDSVEVRLLDVAVTA